MIEKLTDRRDERNVVHGYGACTSGGCNCPGYTGNGQTCENCGHNYSMH